MNTGILTMLHAWPTGLLVFILLLLMLAANELGFRLGLQTHRNETDLSRNVSAALKGSIFALVALLLGFSFSATTGRYDLRQRVVLDQANSISTCYQRAGMLDEPYRGRIRSLLRQYLKLRLESAAIGLSREKLDLAHAEINRVLGELGTSVEEAFRKNSDVVHKSAIIPSANEVGDLSSTRFWAGRNHLPDPVLALLLSGVLISSLLLGHSSGQAGVRHRVLWAASNIVFALVLYVVLDFDRPRQGLIMVDQTPLVELQSAIGTDS